MAVGEVKLLNIVTQNDTTKHYVKIPSGGMYFLWSAKILNYIHSNEYYSFIANRIVGGIEMNCTEFEDFELKGLIIRIS